MVQNLKLILKVQFHILVHEINLKQSPILHIKRPKPILIPEPNKPLVKSLLLSVNGQGQSNTNKIPFTRPLFLPQTQNPQNTMNPN